MFCGRGGIGRRAGFRFLWATVGVQVPSSAPKLRIGYRLFLIIFCAEIKYENNGN